MHRFLKILTIIFVSLIIIQTGAFLFINLFTETSQAADIKFKPQVEIPGFTEYTFEKNGSTKPIGDYIKAIYKYAIGIVGILAAVMLMIGGLIWLTAGGSAERIGKAKEYIGASLTGLILALCSFIILATINPALVEFRITEIKQVDSTALGCCQWNDGCMDNYTEKNCTAEYSGGQKKGGKWKENFTCSSEYCIKKEYTYNCFVLSALAKLDCEQTKEGCGVKSREVCENNGETCEYSNWVKNKCCVCPK